MDALAFSVDEFCKGHRISRAWFYELVAAGQGPRLMRIGRRTLISVESAAEWRRKMETNQGAK